MNEIGWMYDSLTERFGETLGERQKVVDALLIAKTVVGAGALGASNTEGILSVARFILDEWGKCSDTEDQEDSGAPVVLDDEIITSEDFILLKHGTYTFPEGSRWINGYGTTLLFTNGEFLFEETGLSASTHHDSFPFTRFKEDS